MMVGVLMLAMQVTVVPTGDSITVGYGGGRLQNSFNEVVDYVDVERVACGGTTCLKYTGQQVDACTGTFRDFAGDVLAEDPEVIVFMLGTNDAFRTVDDPNFLVGYEQAVDGVFERFRRAVNSHGRHPIVIVTTLIPVLADAGVDALIDANYNPWLQATAGEFGFLELDLNTLIQNEPNWTDFYNDGIHLWANGAEGYLWMADTVRDAVLAALASETCRCTGDLDCDQAVDLADLATVLQSFGGGSGGDVTFDGRTDLEDLALVLARFGFVCEQ